MDKVLEHYHQTIWCRYVCILLGIWLIATPLTFTTHSSALYWNDLLAGLAITVLGIFSLSSRHAWASWVISLIGIWLLFAPLPFWAPDAIIYLNDNVVGILAILFSLLIPGVPHDILDEGPEIPLGWTYNPSSWSQRIPVIALAFMCYLFSRYMAAYQLGYLNHVWDPFFEGGTLKVITSQISKSFPVSDAGLGAFVYILETLMGCKGSQRRWRTMPWIVVSFSILVIPAGLVSIILIMLQPIAVGYWCGWCLLTALCMLFMIALTVDEAAATLSYLFQAKREGKPLWSIFWKGEHGKGVESQPVPLTFKKMVEGVSFSWPLFFSLLIGIWTMFSASYLEIGGIAFRSNQIVGALTVTISVIAMADVLRPIKMVNLLLGAWMIVSTFLTEGFPFDAKGINIFLGVILIFLSTVKKTRIN